MSNPVKRDTHASLIQRIKSLAPTRKERAAILGWSKEYLRKIESGITIPPSVERLISHGVLVVPPDTEIAHETDDTKGADQ